MRIDGARLEEENDALLSEIIDSQLMDKIINAWDESAYGPLMDFGGGVKDVTCSRLLEICGTSAQKLKKIFPLLSKYESEYIVSSAIKQSGYDV